MGGTYILFRASAEVAEVRSCTSTCKDNQGKHTIVLTSRRRERVARSGRQIRLEHRCTIGR